MVRDFKPEDKNLIYESWLKGLYFGMDYYKEIPAHIYNKKYRSVVDLLFSMGAKVKVACLKEDEDSILGYAVYTQDEKRLHWCFTKHAWRKIGIAKQLIPSTIEEVTHISRVGLSILRKNPRVIFNPFLERKE